MAVRNTRPAASLARLACAGLCAAALSACASTGGTKGKIYGGDGDYEDAIGVFANPEADPSGLDPIASAAFWGTRFDREPANAEAAVRYSNALRKIGSTDEAVSVMSKAVTRHPDVADVNLELGKALVEDGRSFEAVRYLETALRTKGDDWRALSAYGVALDQIGEHETAREKYDEALLYAPDAVSVISNKGLSFALSGDLKMAEATLRMAANNRRADARIRQNLALVLALKGNMQEASRLARSDLPPQVADQNINYYRSLMSQPAYWQEYAADAVEAPAFDPPPKAPSSPARAKPDNAPQPLEEERNKDAPNAAGTPVALGTPTPVTNASASATEGAHAPDLKQ